MHPFSGSNFISKELRSSKANSNQLKHVKVCFFISSKVTSTDKESSQHVTDSKKLSRI